MALTDHFSSRGISDFGVFTGEKGGPYTKTSLGRTTPEGARVAMSTTTIKQRSGQSVAVLDSFISESDATLVVGLQNAALDNLRQLYGLPTSALTGDLSAQTPTMETLTIRGDQIGTQERSYYVETLGPRGPRTLYFPRAKVASLPELNFSRTGYTEPTVTLDLYENQDGEIGWIEDAAA